MQQLVKWRGNVERLEDLFFKVELRPITCSIPAKKPGDPERAQTVPRFHAVVAHEPGEVLSVVTDDYQLITNRDAYEAGRHAFERVFKAVRFDELKQLGGHLTARRSACYIDMVHTELEINVFEKDVWYPYMRVANSYNRQRALQISLGFVRSACANGFILGRSVIEYKAAHTRKNFEGGLVIPVPPRWFEEHEAAFVARLKDLRRYPVEGEHMLPLTALALGFQPEDFGAGTERPRKKARNGDYAREQRRWFKDKAVSLFMRYGLKEKMTNLYGVLNMATDFATSPPEGGKLHSGQARLQTKVGEWTDEIVDTVRVPGFRMDDHVRPMQAALDAA